MSRLPALLSEIAEVTDETTALKVAMAAGGTRQYIPAQPTDDHWLVQCVGREAAEAICRHLAHNDETGRGLGQLHLIPMGPTGTAAKSRRILAAALRDGATAAEAARIAGMHERSSFRMARRLKSGKNSEQGELF